MWENYAFYEISVPSAQYRVIYSNYQGYPSVENRQQAKT